MIYHSRGSLAFLRNCSSFPPQRANVKVRTPSFSTDYCSDGFSTSRAQIARHPFGHESRSNLHMFVTSELTFTWQFLISPICRVPAPSRRCWTTALRSPQSSRVSSIIYANQGRFWRPCCRSEVQLAKCAVFSLFAGLVGDFDSSATSHGKSCAIIS
jgi:hypothetical protein